MIHRALNRSFIHMQKSLYLQSSIAINRSYIKHIRRQFVDDKSSTTSTTSTIPTKVADQPYVESIEQEQERATAIEHVEEFELPPIRPTYQVLIIYNNGVIPSANTTNYAYSKKKEFNRRRRYTL